MKLSTRSRYGARILLELAKHYKERPMPVSRISRAQNIPVKYMEQLIRTMKQADLVSSVRGPKGGHVLKKDPKKITLGQVVRLFEGQSELVKCISSPDQCDMADECRVRMAWKMATEALYSKLDAITLANLSEKNPPALLKPDCA